MLLLRLAAEDWNGQTDRQLNIILGDASRNDVSLLSFYHAFDSLQTFWGIE